MDLHSQPTDTKPQKTGYELFRDKTFTGFAYITKPKTGYEKFRDEVFTGFTYMQKPKTGYEKFRDVTFAAGHNL